MFYMLKLSTSVLIHGKRRFGLIRTTTLRISVSLKVALTFAVRSVVERHQGAYAHNLFESWTATRKELFSLFTSLHTTIFIKVSTFSLVDRDDQFENMGETTLRACKIVTSGFRPQLKSFACLSSLFFKVYCKYTLSGLLCY